MDRSEIERLWFADNACPSCRGSGCDTCCGTGQERQEPCPACLGRGTAILASSLTLPCERCRGLGRVPASSLDKRPARPGVLPGWLVLVLLGGGLALAYCLFFLLTHQ